jgi:membrane protein DedA with SNARE-associated domain
LDSELALLLGHGSLALSFTFLVVAGLGVPIPEDLVLLATGAVTHRSGGSLWLAIGVCYVGVLAGDSLVFLSGRRFGPALLEKRLFRGLLPPQRRARVEAMFEKRGSAVVFFARHVAGVRTAVFAVAGMHGMPFQRFVFWDALGALISVPLMTSLGYIASQHLDKVAHGVHEVGHWIGALAALTAASYAVLTLVRRRSRAQAT